MPIGSVTRGTTGTDRLRRVDRWIANHPAFRQAETPLVVDLGFGASATTTLELHQRLSRMRRDVEVVGIEIDPERVERARLAEKPGVRFSRGGFEVPPPDRRGATAVRALNVLRQYDESQVLAEWRRMTARLEPGGVLVEGTCDEIGRIASWADVAAPGPVSLTVSLRLSGLERPSIVAERLPKILIHRNVPGEKIHDLMRDLDLHWQLNSPVSVYGPSQRFIATAQNLRHSGWPVLGSKSRWRLGELTIAWNASSRLGSTGADSTPASRNRVRSAHGGLTQCSRFRYDRNTVILDRWSREIGGHTC